MMKVVTSMHDMKQIAVYGAILCVVLRHAGKPLSASSMNSASTVWATAFYLPGSVRLNIDYLSTLHTNSSRKARMIREFSGGTE